MTKPWEFTTNAKSDASCRRIAAEMVRLFGVSDEEAIGRINQAWRGLDLGGEGDLIYHELPDHWAQTIYRSDELFWWVTGYARVQLGLGPRVPRPNP
jgi:hypothetical protein